MRRDVIKWILMLMSHMLKLLHWIMARMPQIFHADDVHGDLSASDLEGFLDADASLSDFSDSGFPAQNLNFQSFNLTSSADTFPTPSPHPPPAASTPVKSDDKSLCTQSEPTAC